jgi:hypothetical protein
MSQTDEVIINGESYQYRLGRTDGFVVKLVRLTKDEGEREGAQYDCVRYANGTARCSCPDFFYRGHQRPCKHLLAVGLVSTTAEPLART